MSLALTVRKAALLPPWNRNELWRRARAVPSLDLRFAENKSLVDATTGAQLVTFTRASNATFVNSQGLIETASTDVPRFDHNPVTGESLGLLVEEQRVNSIRNNTMVGAVAGTPGTLPTNWPFQAGTNGLAVSIVGTGTESGIAYLDWKISGTTTALATADISFERTAALTGQTWTSSAYVKLVSGSLAAVTTTFIRIVEEDSSTNFVAGGSGSIPLPTTAALVGQRGSFSRTLSGGATVAFVRTNLAVTVSSGATVDFTLRIGLPQLEQGAFATSVIPTTTAAATRSADVASISGSNFSGWYRQDEGTVFVSGSTPRTIESGGGFLALNDPAGGNRIDIRQYRTMPILQGGSGSTASWSGTMPTITINVNFAQAVAYSANSHGDAISGLLEQSTTALQPIAATRLALAMRDGQTAPTGNTGGTFRRIVYWPARLPNSTLQRITQ